MIAPLGKTTFGTVVWRGRAPGTHLGWGGPGGGVHLHAGSLRIGGEDFLGADRGIIGPGQPRCATLAAAQRVVDLWLAGTDSKPQFYDDDPRRKWSGEVLYGVHWTYAGRRHPLWEVAYVRDTGEVYATTAHGPVMVLGVVPADDPAGGLYYRTLEKILDGYAEPEITGRNLAWVIARLEEYAAAREGGQAS